MPPRAESTAASPIEREPPLSLASLNLNDAITAAPMPSDLPSEEAQAAHQPAALAAEAREELIDARPGAPAEAHEEHGVLRERKGDAAAVPMKGRCGVGAREEERREAVVMRGGGDGGVLSDDTPVMRGGADGAYEVWNDILKVEEVHHRGESSVRMDDGWDEGVGGWDAEFMADALLGVEGGGWDGIRGVWSFQLDVRAHRVEPLPHGGSEKLVCSLRQFTLFVSVRDAEGQLADEPDLRLGVSLIYANDSSPVEVCKGEPPMTGETEASAVGGIATFRLRISALSYHHRRQNFRLLVQPISAPPHLQHLSAASEPLRSVARLPNESKQPEVHATPTSPAAAAAVPLQQSMLQQHAAQLQQATSQHAQLQQHATLQFGQPAPAVCATYDAATPCSNSAPTYLGSCASDSPRPSDGTFDVMAELHALRTQLQEEVSHRQAWMSAIAEQGAQLKLLAEQQRQIVVEMRRIAENQQRP
ncbi:hypothetical protein AB1Y20_020351 [Prymnesium parvum]|uniref:C2 NT-type domain-containing protein n=1 Tax=Prymnesium parvum TaxID=97485 RepID=A0AB34JUE6_PRYPA